MAFGVIVLFILLEPPIVSMPLITIAMLPIYVNPRVLYYSNICYSIIIYLAFIQSQDFLEKAKKDIYISQHEG
nr:MAG TPA: hypothetical protein [Caudoviricetes sp.]